MSEQRARCVLLADRHHSLIEGVRGLLETAFGTIFMVADEPSLLDGVQRLSPSVAIVDLALAGRDWLKLLRTLRERSPLLEIGRAKLIRRGLGCVSCNGSGQTGSC